MNKLEFPVTMDNIGFNFGTERVLKNISLGFEKHKTTAIIGPNGSGKTTLLRNIARFLKPASGAVFINGKNTHTFKHKEFAKEISYVHQDTNAKVDFTVEDVVLMGRNPHLGFFETESENDYNIACESMHLTNTYHLKDKKVNEVSGGERQRVFIAQALAQKAGIMLLDEPVSNLDIQHQIEVLKILKKLTEEKKATIILVLHDLNLASIFSDHVILMDKGSVISSGVPAEVITEANIRKTYNIDVQIIKNPNNHQPLIIPLLTM